MATTAYNIHLKDYVGGADFDRNAVDRTLAANSGKRVNVLYNLDSIMGHLSCYFDYEKYGRDLECDYTLEDGYVFRTCG